MRESSPDFRPSSSAAAVAVESAAPEPAGDPAGGMVLSGRNRVCTRARVLAGLALTSGLVAALGTLDTTSSLPAGHLS